MRLIGMLDSPYVRRTAISLRLLGVDFALDRLSVFRDLEELKAVNPVLKAPSFVADDGTVLMDSTLIIEYAQRLKGQSLMPVSLGDFAKAQRVVGLALAACEKSVQLTYEQNLREMGKHHQPWLDRVTGQLTAAFAGLEQLAPTRWFGGESPSQADITMAVAWRFTQSRFAGIVTAKAHPRLAAHSARAEQLPVFQEMDFPEATAGFFKLAK